RRDEGGRAAASARRCPPHPGRRPQRRPARERRRVAQAIAECGAGDADRMRIPLSEKVYTWWSYRAADWTLADRGRRLDHIWVSRALKDGVSDFRITRDARGWERPSDHVPVTVTLEV